LIGTKLISWWHQLRNFILHIDVEMGGGEWWSGWKQVQVVGTTRAMSFVCPSGVCVESLASLRRA
jgi:hypothetical protein